MKTSHAVLSVALCLAIFCCAHGEENVETREEPDSIGHIAKKRSPVFLDDKVRSLYPLIDDDGDVYKRSSLFRFGKRGDDSMDLVDAELPTWLHGKQKTTLPLGKRQFRYGKRQFRYGKRQFRYGKRGTLFRFGRSGNVRDVDERMMSGDYLDPTDLVAKRSAFHWGSDV